MTTLETLAIWLSSIENEHLDFKEAKNQYDFVKLLRYCVAFANEQGGRLVLGISDEKPLRVVGTNAFSNIGETKSQILNKLHFRVEIYELLHADGRVLVFEIPPRPIGQPQHLDGTYWMRSGEELVPMTPDQLRRIFMEEKSNWFSHSAKTNVSPDEIISLLLPESATATVSLVIGAAKEVGLIKADSAETNSTRYARYLPFWA